MAQPTIMEVAALAGVSKETIHRAIMRSPLLAAETRARVERVIAETGYQPEPLVRSPALRRNPLIVLVHDGLADPALPQVIAGLEDILRRSDTMLCIQRFDAGGRGLLRAFGDFLESRRPTGIVALPPLASIGELGGLCWEYGCGYAAFGGDHPLAAERADERGGARMLVDRLVDLGHRRIGFIAGPEGDPSAQQRELGYLDAMADHGLDRGAALIAGGDGSFASGLAAAGMLLEVSPAPTAIMAASDEMAAGAIRAARVQRLTVPGDLSVTGFGDDPLAAALTPSLTTARVPLADMAREAALRMLAPQTSPGTRVPFKVEIVERESTGPVSAQAGSGAAFAAFQSG